jgi:ribonuclease P protein component
LTEERLRGVQRLRGAAVGLVLGKGRARRGEFFRLQFRPNTLALARIALVVSKRHARRAVDRSRVRRLIREAFRRHQMHWRGFDCVVRLIGTYSPDARYADDLARLFGRAP